MGKELIPHSHLMMGSMMLHIVVILQRMVVMGGMSGLPFITAVNAATSLIGAGFIMATICFLLFAIKKVRKKVPKLVFVCMLFFNILLDGVGAALFGAFVGKTDYDNAKMLICGCLITTAFILILEAASIVIFFVFKAPGLKSHKAVDEKPNADDKDGDDDD